MSRPGVDELLYLAIELINSSSEKGIHFIECLFEILSNMPMSICQSWAILKDEWRACQRSLISRQGQLLYLTASTAGSLHLLVHHVFYALYNYANISLLGWCLLFATIGFAHHRVLALVCLLQCYSYSIENRNKQQQQSARVLHLRGRMTASTTPINVATAQSPQYMISIPMFLLLWLLYNAHKHPRPRFLTLILCLQYVCSRWTIDIDCIS